MGTSRYDAQASEMVSPAQAVRDAYETRVLGLIAAALPLDAEMKAQAAERALRNLHAAGFEVVPRMISGEKK